MKRKFLTIQTKKKDIKNTFQKNTLKIIIIWDGKYNYSRWKSPMWYHNLNNTK